jgi:hypothetical protein
MNIFVFDPCPNRSALWLDDVRKNKMILETAQLLSTSIRLNDPTTQAKVYKVTHKGHPCTVWARRSRSNFKWLLRYLNALGEQFCGHKSLQLIPFFDDYASSGWFPNEQSSGFANCARNASQGLDFTNVPCVHTAYRMYICERWKRDTIRLSWNKGEKPYWCT